MKGTLWQISKEGFFYYAKMSRDKWIAENLGMVTLAGSQIWWTWETEDTFLQVRLSTTTSLTMSPELSWHGKSKCSDNLQTQPAAPAWRQMLMRGTGKLDRTFC